MRTVSLLAVACAGMVCGATTASAQSTVRIESRPFYGATVTMEEGVRVFRPLPAHDRVIINPNNATPITIDVGSPQTRRTYVEGARR